MVDEPGPELTKAEDGGTLVPSAPTAPAVHLPAAGYALGDPIGRGGMGEVVVARDLRIDREVAIKRMTAVEPNADQVARFLREAKIQARLGHPAIVPVHELGLDTQGRPFFTMKRLTGKTLAQQLSEKQAVHRMPLNSLLRVFVEVCFAIEFAHRNNVVHRDLKPSNIMLGNFGEVYVIDWGIARVLHEEHDDVAGEPAPNLGDIKTLDQGTKSGALLGTPGYMAPEQLRGQKATPAADLYGLGSILFEILAGEPLHKRGEPGILSTLGNPQQSPGERKPDRAIPPELDAICVAALAELPEQRPTARRLAERIQAFLDGDRDLERRRVLAREQLVSARLALDSDDPDARAVAMRRAGRALALDPESEEAAALVSSLLLTPPVKPPADLEAGLDEEERKLSRDRSRRAVWAYLSVFVLLPLAVFSDIKNWPAVVAFYGTVSLGALSSWWFSRTGRPSMAIVLTITLAIAVLFTRVASPFVLTPLMVCCAIAALSQIGWIIERGWTLLVWSALAVVMPIALEWTGVLARTWSMGDGALVIVSDMVRSKGTQTEVALAVGNLVFTLVIATLTVMIARRRRTAQHQLFVQAWHLRQLLPSNKQPWAVRAR